MKQALVDLRSGEVKVEDLPFPVPKGDGVLVRNRYSVISGGTEGSLLKLANASYIGKARKKPDMFAKAVKMAREQGPITAFRAVKGRLDKPEPLGYSSAGIVISVNGDAPFSEGDRVACAGVGFANHADVVYVPKNLCAKVPEGVELRDAAFTTLGAIAMQGIRNAKLGVGERAAVIGLGLIGQLTVQILKASGCEVFGIESDRSKLALAKKLGLDGGCMANAQNLEDLTGAFTESSGFDAVIITAATESNQPLVSAGKIARHKGRIVLVGVVGMELPRDLYYSKELEFVVSCSYGPGRYDPKYEELGHDYPIGYVRWTEKRNMESFLRLLHRGAVDPGKLATHEHHITEASEAYDLIRGVRKEPYLGVVLKYDEEEPVSDKISFVSRKKRREGDVRIGWIGAGSFATSTLLPAIKGVKGLDLVGLAGSDESSASTARKYGFEYVTSDPERLLDDDRIDAIVITSRNSAHARYAITALKKGKHVYVEKPLAVNRGEMDRIIKAHKRHPDLVIQVGYNRRHAPLVRKMRDYFSTRKGPMMVNYRISAGKLPDSYWIYHEKEGGSRWVSEMCHFVDLCSFLIGSEIAGHHVYRAKGAGFKVKDIMENSALNMRFKDGSVASVQFNTVGDPTSKEYLEVHCEGASAVLADFRVLRLFRNGRTRVFKDRLKTDKGHRGEMEHFVRSVKEGTSDFESYVKGMEVILGER